ncbi:hypothetical protein [Actinomadura keratinilytica]|uniref:MFS transporter n=1 Tax=Actinomadura keratinilytica TaxID=547461 RepID=A0ABP7ZF83_9ACTN
MPSLDRTHHQQADSPQAIAERPPQGQPPSRIDHPAPDVKAPDKPPHHNASRPPRSLAQLPIALAITADGLLAPRLAAIVGIRPALAAALAPLTAGLLWLAPARTGLGPAGLAVLFLLVGAGIGLSFGYVTALAAADARPGESGLLGGLVNTARQMGGALGLAALVAVAASATGEPDLTAAFRATAALAAIAPLASLPPTCTPPTRRPPRRLIIDLEPHSYSARRAPPPASARSARCCTSRSAGPTTAQEIFNLP